MKKEWRSRPVRGNCLWWALRQCWRRGGWLAMRNADLAIPFLHFGWAPRQGRHIYHFRPRNPNVRFPWPWLHGYIQRHEDAKR